MEQDAARHEMAGQATGEEAARRTAEAFTAASVDTLVGRMGIEISVGGDAHKVHRPVEINPLDNLVGMAFSTRGNWDVADFDMARGGLKPFLPPIAA